MPKINAKNHPAVAKPSATSHQNRPQRHILPPHMQPGTRAPPRNPGPPTSLARDASGRFHPKTPPAPSAPSAAQPQAAYYPSGAPGARSM